MGFETGIYRHFKKGNLYFAEGIETDTDDDNECARIRYHSLYPNPLSPFSKRLSLFTNTVPWEGNWVRRFNLIQPLPAEKLQLLLPGTKVELPCDNGVQKVTVHGLSEIEEGKIQVRLLNEQVGEVVIRLEVIEFLNSFSSSHD